MMLMLKWMTMTISKASMVSVEMIGGVIISLFLGVMIGQREILLEPEQQQEASERNEERKISITDRLQDRDIIEIAKEQTRINDRLKALEALASNMHDDQIRQQASFRSVAIIAGFIVGGLQCIGIILSIRANSRRKD
jgi:Na+-transporting NADH:ubiquinone oxidoreductase subunit NqrC